jgi:hypothetical protein
MSKACMRLNAHLYMLVPPCRSDHAYSFLRASLGANAGLGYVEAGRRYAAFSTRRAACFLTLGGPLGVALSLFLAPGVDPTTASALAETGLLSRLIDALGSPLNIVLPRRLADNMAAFREVYSRHRLAGKIYYANKANRSSAPLRELAATAADVDVASLGELQHALGAGLGPERIVATGPKNTEFL